MLSGKFNSSNKFSLQRINPGHFLCMASAGSKFMPVWKPVVFSLSRLYDHMTLGLDVQKQVRSLTLFKQPHRKKCQVLTIDGEVSPFHKTLLPYTHWWCLVQSFNECRRTENMGLHPLSISFSSLCSVQAKEKVDKHLKYITSSYWHSLEWKAFYKGRE